MNKARKTSSAQTTPALNVHSQAAGTEFLLYETEDGRTRVECRFVDDSLWLPQALMAQLFQTSKQNISLHVKNVLAEGELQAAATVKDYLTVQTEGTRQVRRKVQLYNLDMILAVGYRVKSPRGTQFRRWATERLGEYRQRAREVFADRLTTVAAPLRWVKQLPQTRLQLMTVQWGSCSPSGRITLNPLLVKAPRECIDYVLLHELCHLLQHNHSPKFYRTLDRHMPNWRAVKEKLDNMAEEVFRA